LRKALTDFVPLCALLIAGCTLAARCADSSAEKRNVSLVQGSPINLDMKNAKLDEILTNLDKQSGVISFLDQQTPILPIIVDDTEKRGDFSFSGNYWSVVDRLLTVYPTTAPAAGEREDLESDRWQTTLTPLDLNGANFSAGVFRMRVARVVRERGPGGEFLSLVVLPFLEPRFTFDELKFKVEKVVFDGKREVPVENCEFAPDLGLNHPTPSRDYRICIPIKSDFASARTATIEGSIVLKCFELTTHTHEFSRASGYDLPGGVKFTLDKDNDGAFNLRFGGKGNFPFGLSYALDNGGLICLDKDGKSVEISARGGGAGTGGGSWNLNKRINFTGKVTQIKMIAPLPRPHITFQFALRDLILPRSEAPAALAAVPVARPAAALEPSGEFPVDAATRVTPESQKAAFEYIARLNADDFDQREQAARALMKMELPLLPWLRGDLEKDTAREKYSGETRDRLNRVVRAMEQRNYSAIIRQGTHVSLDMNATLKDFLTELHRQTGNAFNGIERDDHRVPRVVGYEEHDDPPREGQEVRHALQYKGTYWGAMDKLFKLFPPAPWEAGKAEQFNLTSGSGQMVKWDDAAMATPGASQYEFGICRVRVARVGWERGVGGEFLSLVLMPMPEPRYLFHDVKLEAPKLMLDGKTALESSSASLSLAIDSEGDIHRGCELWAKVGPEIPRARTLSLSGKLSMSVIELVPASLDISRGAESYLLPCGIEMRVSKLPDGKMKFRMEGAGRMNNGFSERRDETAFAFLDKNGKTLAIEEDEYDSGEEWDDEDESVTWYYEGTIKFKLPDEKIMTVKLITPIMRPPVTLPLSIPLIELPVSGR